ncbi:MAG: TonB-dependent receptor [Bacteroidales bacterium]|jgi:outer membrane cobalamin receptor|nr:TonB-dependent receptor [Bacteroidales bacterium]
MRRLLIALLFLWLLGGALLASAQTIFSIKGTVRDADTKETLIGANVYLKESLNGMSTDINGRFEIKERQGYYILACSFIGYIEFEQAISLNKDLTIDIDLNPSSFMGETVEIVGGRVDQNVRSAEVGLIELPMKRIERLPVLFGEPDILKTIQLLPGIQSGGEGSNSFYVRGGGADQNLILLDDATVYNPSHLFGFFSVFNSDIVNSADILKAGIPAEYGGRMSSVLNITAKEGDLQNYRADIGVGLISARAKIEGFIQKDKSSFILAGRRTYVDVFLKPFSKGTNFEGVGYYFYDLNGKLSFHLSEKDHVFVGGYYGKDVFNFQQKDDVMGVHMYWNNAFASVRWVHFFKPDFYLNTSVIFTDYKFAIDANESVFDMRLFSGVQDWTAKSHLVWQSNTLNKVKMGMDYIFHTFTPSSAMANSNEVGFDLGDPQKMYAHDFSTFIQHEWDPLSWLKILYGVRYNYFAQVGPFTRYQIDDIYNMNNIDSTLYGRESIVSDYHTVDPRINMRFQLDRTKSIKTSYTLNHQSVNLAAMSTSTLPMDVWFPSTELVKPQKSHQFSLGYFQNFMNNTIETSVEAYYKLMDNLIEFQTGANVANALKTNYDWLFTYGKGNSYGIEFFINKTAGKFTGWIGYTLSWTTRNFDDIMNGKTFYARFDRRHDVSILLSYKLNDQWDFSAVWVFASGNASTIPAAFYFMEGRIITEWGDYNAWRMPNYHRLDLSANWNLFEKKHVSGSLNFSVYNTYNRKNPYYISYRASGNLSERKLQISAYQVSIFPIVPSIAFNMKIR